MNTVKQQDVRVLKVAHIVISMHPGGLERVVLNLVKQAELHSVLPYIYCLDALGEWGDALYHNGFPISTFGKRNGIDLKLVVKLVRRLRLDGIDVIHSHNIGPLLYASLAAMITRIPLITTKHGRNDSSNMSELWINRFGGWVAYKVVAVSDDALRVATVSEKISDSKVLRVYNGIDVPQCSADAISRKNAKAKLGITSSTYVFGIVARLSREKKHLLMLDAFANILRIHNNSKMIVVGDGPMRAQIESKVRMLGLQNHVVMLGNRNDITEILHAFDVFVLSSSTEGLSISLLEAMALGVPVVATDVGGNRELLGDGDCGNLVPSVNVDALASGMLDMLASSSKRELLGHKARMRVISLFSVEKMLDAYVHLYREAVSGRELKK